MGLRLEGARRVETVTGERGRESSPQLIVTLPVQNTFIDATRPTQGIELFRPEAIPHTQEVSERQVGSETRLSLGKWLRGRRRTPSVEKAADVMDQPPAKTGTDDIGGEPPVNNGRVEEFEWDENDRRVAEIIGWETVTTVKRNERRLRDLTEFKRRPDPFKEDKPEVTIIDEQTSDALDFIEQFGKRYFYLKEGEDIGGLRAKASVLANTAKEHVPYFGTGLQVNTSTSERIRTEIRALDLPQVASTEEPAAVDYTGAPDPTLVFVEEVGAIHQALDALASDLPQTNVLNELNRVLNAERAASNMVGYLVGRGLDSMSMNVRQLDEMDIAVVRRDQATLDHYQTLRTFITQEGHKDIVVRSTQRSPGQISDDANQVERFIPRVESLSETGSRLHLQIKEKVKEGSLAPIQDLYATLGGIEAQVESDIANGLRPKQMPFEDLEKAALVEAYLGEKAKFLEATIREMHGRVPQDQWRGLRLYQDKKYSPVFKKEAKQRTRAEREANLKLPEDFRLNAELLHNIVAGGGRIEEKDADVISFAVNLRRLMAEGIDDLPPETHGLVVALAAEKFNTQGVLQVMDEFADANGDEGSELLRALRQNTPIRYKAIADFDRTSLLETVNLVQEIMENQYIQNGMSAEMTKTFGADRIDIVKTGLQSIRDELLGRAKGIEIKDYEQLEWKILPEGTLREEAQNLIRELKERSRSPESIEIDLKRLTILEELKASWDKGEARYARGKLGKRRHIDEGKRSQEPEEYIILVLPYTDDEGNQREHAIAESPVKRRNALYIHRADVSGESWRDVLSMRKDDAHAYGARGLNHRARAGEEIYASMVHKTTRLLEVPAEDFPDFPTNRL